MLKKILISITAIVVLLLTFAATRPDSFRVERSITIQAPAAKIFPLLNDFHHFPSWSPWQHLDTAMKTTFSGAASGVGAVYDWDGNDQVGAGRMEIMQTAADSKVTVKLDFYRPFASQNTSEYAIQTAGGTSTVTWAMYGPSPYISKLMGLFVSMDSMIGKDFEKGLSALRTVAEKQ
jgi:uncharacterized protein YndB with AHSA1/START domain